MDLSLNEHQRMLAQSARTFMQRRMPKATIVALQTPETGYQPQTWSTIAELGWLGLLIPIRLRRGRREFDRRGRAVRGVRPRAVARPVLQLRGAERADGDGSGNRRAARPHPARDCGRAADLHRRDHRAEAFVGTTGRGDGGRASRRATTSLTAPSSSSAMRSAASHLIVAVRTGSARRSDKPAGRGQASKGVGARNLPGLLSWQAEVTFEAVEVGRMRCWVDARTRDGRR